MTGPPGDDDHVDDLAKKGHSPLQAHIHEIQSYSRDRASRSISMNLLKRSVNNRKDPLTATLAYYSLQICYNTSQAKNKFVN